MGIPAADPQDQLLLSVLAAIEAQEVQPDLVVLAVPSGAQVEAHDMVARYAMPLEITTSEAGTASQRNAILSVAQDFELVHFVDSDVVLSASYLRNMADHFTTSDVAGISGTLEFPHGTSRRLSGMGRILRRIALACPPPGRVSRAGIVSPLPNTSGGLTPTTWMSAGVMSIRMSEARDLRFSEDLQRGPTGPYAMAEDVHFSLRLGQRGPMAVAGNCRAVHLGDESWKATDPAFWEMKTWSRMILARDFPGLVSPTAIRYAATCDLLAQTLLSSGDRRRAALRGLTRGLGGSFGRGRP